MDECVRLKMKSVQVIEMTLEVVFLSFFSKRSICFLSKKEVVVVVIMKLLLLLLSS